LREVDERLKFASEPSEAFPILLVLSEINWRPLDDFFRLSPQDGELRFEGNYSRDEHFPGAKSGGARATFLSRKGKGWGLVSADGWRVPYRGSDCVVYHEGLGHTVGLPHPDAGNGSVMSLGQYQGWLSESWLDKDQKSRLGWQPDPSYQVSPQLELFGKFRALPEPKVPVPDQPVRLRLDWPKNVDIKSIRVRYQTSLESPWIELPRNWKEDLPTEIALGTFDRATPVSYRIDAQTQDGSQAEIWGYFQVRQQPKQNPMPLALPTDLAQSSDAMPLAGPPRAASGPVVDLLDLIDPAKHFSVGTWQQEGDSLVGPKQFGARIEIPFQPPAAYRLHAVVEPLDQPNGLILGQRNGNHRFLTLVNYGTGDKVLSALENVDGQNIGNDTTIDYPLLQQGRLSQIVVTVEPKRVRVSVDGTMIIDWQGEAQQLSLSDYWKTPNSKALFLGAYDCRYRFHQLLLEPLEGQGRAIMKPDPE